MTLGMQLCLAVVGFGCLLASADAACASTTASPELALSLMGDTSPPKLFLAQRQIDRTWGLSDDSVYREVDIPQWRSEAVALALSAAAPGAGQAYSGSKHAWVYALTEAAGWTSRWLYLRRGRELANEAAAYAGAPDDTTSRWSFDRWASATNGDAGALRALYVADRDVFYDRIANDQGLLSGWAGNAVATRTPFSDLRQVSDDRLRVSRYSGTAIWINHIVSAFDALRAARLKNVSLGHGTRLGMASGWRHGSPTLRAALRRSF